MLWIYSAVIDPNLLYRVAFWWNALDIRHNVRLLDRVRLATQPLAKQLVKFTVTRHSALFSLLIVPSLLYFWDWPGGPLDIDYLSVEYCFKRVSTFWSRAGATELIIRLFPRHSWMYIPTAPNSTEGWVADKLNRAGALLPKSSLIDLGMPLTSFKLIIERNFSQDANLACMSENLAHR